MYILPTKDPLQAQGHIWIVREGRKKDVPCKQITQDKIMVLISDKIEDEIVVRDKEIYYIMIKGSIQEEGITIVTINEPSIGTLQY